MDPVSRKAIVSQWDLLVRDDERLKNLGFCGVLALNIHMHTIDTKEIENFAKDSSHWWDENGPFKPLHRLNPVRLSYIKDQICAHFDKDRMSFKPYSGLSILDVGCGGGLVCEPMARLGANITGIDADKNAIEVAKAHAAQSGLTIDYKCASTDDLIKVFTPHPNLPPSRGGKALKSSPLLRGEDLGGRTQYDIVLALEIIEHVSSPQKFVNDITSLCKPHGIIIFSTINRTPKSFALAKIAAEYILGWVPRGTHDWNKFIKPSELAKMVRASGGKTGNVTGMIYNPLSNEFKLSPHDVDVNYFLSCFK